MWYDEALFYQIYPLGLCGAPKENDGNTVDRISRIIDWIPHMQKMGVNAIYFSPLFESDCHGYDTRDYTKLDCRLGTNADFKKVVDELHKAGIKVVVDGVFNHVGRGFFGFKDVQEKKWDSPYKDWFKISFEGNSNYNDGFWYEGWEGFYNLVKLNLENHQVVEYLLNCVRGWIEEFDIDGIRLDVAYCLNHNFMRELRNCVDNAKSDFFLVGEMLHGDYNMLTNNDMLHSVTNYECYKGLFSSFNSMNMFEIEYSLNRQFGKQYSIYPGKHLLCFVDNHDVSRVASILTNKKHIPLIYTVLFGMPGIPCIYYGSEWGIEGNKGGGDDWCLRPEVEMPEWNELTDYITKLGKIKKEHPALSYGDYEKKYLTNKQCIFERHCDAETLWICINCEENAHTAYFNGNFKAVDLLTGNEIDVNGSVTLEPYGSMILKIIN